VHRLFQISLLLTWTYPAFMIALGLLISYQSYKLMHVFSLGLTALTILDGVVLVLAWHEYRFTLRTKSPTPNSSSLD
jgi:uncharacterized membrane protein